MPMQEVERSAEILKFEGLLVDHDNLYALTEKGKQTAQYLFDIADSHQNEVFKYSDKGILFTMLRDFAGVA